jgi:hypothetical protein
VAEWEELLVRLEIMPRALRVALEEPVAGRARVLAELRELLRRERRVEHWLEGAAGWAPALDGAPAADGEELGGRELAERHAAVRARNFAMLQRRGVEVWRWSGATDDGAPATVYQLLSWLLRADAGALAALRRPDGAPGPGGGGRAC